MPSLGRREAHVFTVIIWTHPELRKVLLVQGTYCVSLELAGSEVVGVEMFSVAGNNRLGSIEHESRAIDREVGQENSLYLVCL